jgi:hypothetical protein
MYPAPVHIHTADGGDGCTLHVHTAGGGQGYTLHVHTASGREMHPTRPRCWWRKEIHPVSAGKTVIPASAFLGKLPDSPASTFRHQ